MNLSFFSTLFLILLVLKLCGLIGLGWWWVFSPLLFPFILFFLLIPALIFIAVIVAEVLNFRIKISRK